MAEHRTLRILTLSGGVSRQPAAKRSPYQAENLDNCLVSLERSVEKRPGFSVLPGVGSYDLSFLPASVDPHFTWFQLDRANRYLVIIDKNAVKSTDKVMYAIKVDEDSWEDYTPASQWDPTDSSLQWDGIESFDESDDRYPLLLLATAYESDDTLLEKYNTILGQGVVDKSTREYLCYGDTSAREHLRSLQIGTNIIFLNTEVYAGFTSGTNGKKVGLNGLNTTEVDDEGGKITYFTTTKIVKTTDGRMYNEGYTPRDGEEMDPDWTAQFIPVEDFVYGDFEKPWLGQSVRNFGELRFPPDNNDWLANNSNSTTSDSTARTMLSSYYDSDLTYGNYVDGRGRVVYCDAPYLSLDAGYYRIISFPEGNEYDDGFDTYVGTGKPYTQKVRTPDYCSVLDSARMPHKIVFNNGSFSLKPIDWAARTVGDRNTNPGPSPFLTTEGEARHVKLNAMANFRDRLFIASGDVVFSSQLGVIEDMWIKDPSNVIVSDPIDIRASSNSYAEITAMLPYNQYLFINTKGGVQFELKGDNNLISPLTAEVSSTTFYSTADLVDPMQLGSQLYFFDKERLYIYLNQDSREFNTAVELSNSVRGYLPSSYQDATVAVSQNYLMCVDADAQNHLYVYCGRFDGDKVAQSAFWRYILSEYDSIKGIKAWDEYLYAVVLRSVEGRTGWYIMQGLLEQQDTNTPRLDSMSFLEITALNTSARAVETSLIVPYIIPSDDCYVVLSDEFDGLSYSVFRASDILPQGSSTRVTFSGIDLTEHIGKSVWVGTPFEMRIDLSTQYLRDQNFNIVEGVLNLKTMQVRHSNTGYYKVIATRRNRNNPLVSEFSATDTETTDVIDTDGVFTAKIFGFSDEVDISITNDKLSPCNITQIEIKSVFNQKNSSIR